MTHALPKKQRPRGARKKKPNAALDLLHHDPVIPVTQGYLTSFDGTQIFYSIEGESVDHRVPLVFCYGLVCSSLHWTYQIEALCKTHQTIWFDYRGHHHSGPLSDLESLTFSNIVQDLHLLLDHLKIPRIILLGHSMGVNIVLEYYRQYPEQVDALVLISGTARRPLETFFHHNAFEAGFQLFARLYQWAPQWGSWFWKSCRNNPFIRTLVTLGGFNRLLTPREDIELYIKQAIDIGPEIFFQMISQYNQHDAISWIHMIQCKTLILAGQLDQVIPLSQQECLHQLIPKSQLEMIPQGSHCPQMDLPDQVIQSIEKFLLFVRTEETDPSSSLIV